MWLKFIILIAISTIFISYGFFRYKKSLSTTKDYDLTEDFKHTFLTFHSTYSSHDNDGEQRRIIPVLMIVAGVGIFIIGLFKIL